MAVKERTDEREEDDDEFEDFFSDDEELDGEDEEVLDSQATRDKIRKEIEDSIVEELAKGDTNSRVYKGLQGVVNKKDAEAKRLAAELSETRNALAGLIQKVNGDQSAGQTEFLTEIIQDLLDDDSKKLYKDKLDRFNASRKQKNTEDMLQQILSREQQQRFNVPMYGRDQEAEDVQIAQYRKDATVKLKAMAKKMGVDPEAEGLDFGDEDEALLVRLDKLASSVEKVSTSQEDKDLADVKRRTTAPNTRTRQESSGGARNTGARLLERGSQKMIEQMRKM